MAVRFGLRPYRFIQPMRSKLFVPGSRPELFAKAMASEADGLSFDLEDAVDEAMKDDARRALAHFLANLAPGRNCADGSIDFSRRRPWLRSRHQCSLDLAFVGDRWACVQWIFTFIEKRCDE